jgi:hypothetical protein
MSKRDPKWPGSFEDTEREHQKAFVRASSQERLRWLEQAMVFAYQSGAFKPRRRITQQEWDSGRNLKQALAE